MPQPTVANPSPLSFTPTSVMRKTAAERKDSDPRVAVPELKVVVVVALLATGVTI